MTNQQAIPGEIWYRRAGALTTNEGTIPAGPNNPFAVKFATIHSAQSRPEKIMILGENSISPDGTIFYNVLNLKNNNKLNIDTDELFKYYVLIYPAQ